MAEEPLDARHPAIRETLRGIARTHGEPARRSATDATEAIKRLIITSGADLAETRGRAHPLLCITGALRRSELIGLDLAHLRPTPLGMRLVVVRSKTDKVGEGAEIGMALGSTSETCPVRAVRSWLKATARAATRGRPPFGLDETGGSSGSMNSHSDSGKRGEGTPSHESDPIRVEGL